MPTRDQLEAVLLPHLDAAYNLARWLVGDEHEARDALQTACERAIRYFAALQGEEARAWFLGITRNACMNILSRRSARGQDLDIDTVLDDGLGLEAHGDDAAADVLLERRADRERVNEVLRGLNPLFREVLVLREMEDLSYAEIAAITAVPLGTVMSRLARARKMFRAAFLAHQGHAHE